MQCRIRFWKCDICGNVPKFVLITYGAATFCCDDHLIKRTFCNIDSARGTELMWFPNLASFGEVCTLEVAISYLFVQILSCNKCLYRYQWPVWSRCLSCYAMLACQTLSFWQMYWQPQTSAYGTFLRAVSNPTLILQVSSFFELK